MKNFRTVLSLPDYPLSINHDHGILSVGSCFAENIGRKLTAGKFRTLLNPFGIIYNPASAAVVLETIFSERQISEEEVFFHNDLWHSRLHHGAFSNADKAMLLSDLAEQTRRGNAFLQSTDRLLLTFGTAFVWEEKTTGLIAANCHKRPQSNFLRRRLSVNEIIETLLPILQKMKAGNNDLEVIITVSPVRHMRDGFVENQRSKAVLLLAAEEMCGSEAFINYFPAYEIVQDDLRDYRFYTEDMLHPSAVAVAYVWERFGQAFFSAETQTLLNKIKQIQNAVAHRPFRPHSAAHQAFLSTHADKIKLLSAKYPQLDFSEEAKQINRQILN